MGTKKALKPDVAQAAPSSAPAGCPCLQERLNEAAGAVGNEPEPSLGLGGAPDRQASLEGGGDQRDGAVQARGGVAMPPGGSGAAVPLPTGAPTHCASGWRPP